MNKFNYLIKNARQLWQFAIALVVYSLLTVSAQAQLANVPVTGFTNDLVANGVGDGTNGTTLNTSTTGNMNGMVTQPAIGVDGVGYTFIDATYKWWTGSTAPACYLPTGGVIPSALTSGLTYQLQSYSAFNAMTIASNTYSGSVWPTTGSVSLVTPASYTNLYVLYESVMNTAGPTITATVTFTDATTQVFSGNTLVNWFTATGVAYTPSISRAQNVAAGAANACATGPYLFQMNLVLSAGNYGKTVQSISFNWSAAIGAAANTVDYFHVLAVGGLTPCSGSPTPGNTLSTANPACPSVNFTLSMQNGTGGGATYQWQSSPDGSTWTDISGATSPTRVASQIIDTYYQCVVTCGANTGTSTPIYIPMAAPLSGTYTINSGAITGGTNFQTFVALKDILNCAGVSGPVTVNVVAASGPYNEQVQFNAIPGASAINTITINGNGNTLTFGATLSSAPGTLVLNGTDYMTVNNLIVTGTGGTYALACHLYNQADNNTFSGCTFNVPANCTNTTQVPFSISGSATTVLTSGLSGNNNLVTGCTMFSGYYSTVFYGNSSGANTGNQLINSTLLDFYFYGAYTAYQNGIIISNNTIERPTRTTLSTFYGVYVTTGNLNVLVEKNKVRNPFGATITNTSTAYGIYGITASTSGNENKIYNNLVSDMKSGGIIYGIHVTSYYKVYHNTVSLDETGSTSTSTLYGLYCASVTSTDFRNNIISVTRGGTGTKYMFYWSSLPTISNNNGVYLSAAAGTNYYAYVGGTTYTSFATYQTAQSRDGASIVANPSFLNPLTYNYTPTQSLLNDIGTSLGVLTDITGASRSVSTPDPGAIEFTVGPCAGTPGPGNTIASSNPACANSTLTLSLQNPTIGTGVTYQWQTSPDGSTWTNVSGANSSTYSLLQTTDTYYQCLVTCATGPSTGTSTSILVNQNPLSACYCTPSTTAGTTYYISNFTTTLGTTNINNTSAGSATGYQNYFATASMSAVQNTSVNYTMTIAGGSTYGKAIWVDWNQDGTFAAGEQVASSAAYVSSPISGSFTVPLSATPGTTRMRIIASFTPNNPSNPCSNSGNGEYEDYAFTVIALSNCSGTPAPGNTISSSNPACANASITLSLQNTNLGVGISYQWQTSPDGSTWSNVSGATSLTYVVTQSTATYYQCIVTCSFGSSGNSTPLLVTQNPLSACYCTPTTTGGSTYYISNLLTTGGTTNINNTSGGSATGYQNHFSTASMSAMQGTSVNYTMTIAGSGTYGKAIWVDWNQDGTFAAGEQVASSASYVASPISGGFTVPLTATTGTTRMRIVATFTPNNPSNPCSNSGNGEYEDYAFDVIPLPNCVAPPASVTSSMTVPGAVCGSGSKVLTLSGISPASGLTYQWQESVSGTPGTFVDVTTGTGGTTNTFTTATLTSSMYFLCEVGCSFGGGTTLSSSTQVVVSIAPTLSVTPISGTNVCSGSNVDLTATGANSYSWVCNPAYPTVLSPGSTAYPAVSTFITPNNLSTVTSRPTSTLASGTGSPPATISTTNWEYKVTGTALNGCTSQQTIYLTVINNPVVPLQLTYTNSPAPVCEPGTPITFTVNNTGTIGAGSWIYNWYDQSGTTLLQTNTNTASTNTYTPTTPLANGNYIYTAKVSNTVCPSSYAIASPTYFVGYTSLNVVTNANCGDNGVLNVYPEGQTNFSTWYSNNFNTGLNGPAFDALYGNAVISSGLCNITTQTNSQNGTLLVRNPAAINTNNLQVDFKLSTAPRGMAFGILGADGLAWSYAPDVWQGQLTPGTGGFQAEGGSGTGFKLAFDATANGAGNTPGCYLMYNCTTPDQGPSSPGVIAFKQGSWWQGLVNAPVSIIISQNGFVTVTVNNQVIFDHVALPSAYLTANKSNWLHAFTARTGGSNELHAIDDLNIRYNTYEYSINSTNGTDGTWQSANSFNGLSAATYPVWVRNPGDPLCFANTGTAVIGTSPSPSSAITVAAAGFGTTICAGSSTDLTTDVSVPGATFLWESSSSLGGPYAAASGVNNTGTYSTGALLANTYYRCTFTCPSASPITSTPVLVTVNVGSISTTNSPQTINCIGDAATLTATPGANTTCVWYAAPSGGSPLANGNSYVVNPASLPVTYYVEPVTTLFTDHYNEGGQKVIANTFGTTSSGAGIATRFTTSSSIRIDSIKVVPSAAGALTVALQNSGSAGNILTYNTTITAAQVGSFINIPVNFAITGSGNYQLTTSGINCTYYSSYTGTYAAPYMSLGGVFTIVGGSTTATGATSTSMYGTAFTWSITTSCPAGLGARVPVTVTSNPTYLVTVTPSSLPNFCPTTIQAVTASSPNPYSSYTWSPVTNLYSDAAATIPLTLTDNQATVYFKAPSAGSNVFTVSTAASGCTNTATASITVQTALPIVTSATPGSVCSGSNVQLQATVSSASAYCNATGGTGTYFMNNFSTTGGVTNITNNSSGFSPGGYNFFSALSVTQAVGSSINWSASNFSVGTYGVAVFVDWNQNGLFTDAGDQMYSSGTYVTSATGSIAVPAGALNGITRMRVVVDYLNTAPGSCDVATSHETEDYNFVVTGGVPVVTSYNYDWSSNSTFLSATNISNPVAQAMTSTQTYSVQVTDPSTGCLNTSTIVVEVNDLPIPSASSNTPICEGQSLSFFGDNTAPGQSTGNGYLWNGPNGFNDIVQNPSISSGTPAAAGTYTLTVTNQDGCTATITTQVNVNPNPALNIMSQTDVSCTGGSDGSFTIEVTNGSGFYLFDENGNFNFDGIFLNYAAGSYNILVTDGNSCSSSIGVTLGTISSAPPVGSCTITSLPLDACVGSTITVSTNVSPGATGYTWSAPAGTLINGLPGPVTTITNTASITLGSLAPNSSGWQICAFALNGCGQTNTNCKFIRGALSLPAAISGSTVACPSTVGNYSTLAVGGASSYAWTITGDATVSGSGTTGSVTFGPSFTSGSLCVRALLPCGYLGPQRCMTISNGTPLLGVMSGTFTVCPGATGVTYSVPPSPGANSYNWTVPAGATIATGSGTNSITVNFGSGYTNGNVCVTAQSICGINSLPRCKTVGSNKPSTPGNIVGSATGVCNQTITYSVPTVSGATGYTWTAPAGATVVSGQNTNTVDVTYSNLFTTGSLCVTADNGCGSSTARCIPVKGTPSNPGAITGPATVCAFDAGTVYSINPVFGATGYVWTIPSGTTIVSGQGTTTLTLDWGTNGGVIGVTASGVCGSSGTRTLNVVMNCRISGSSLPGATVNAYPNPVSSQLNIELNAIDAGNYSIQLVDLAGRMVYNDLFVAVEGVNSSSLDVSNYAKGVYTLIIKNNNGFARQIRVEVQ